MKKILIIALAIISFNVQAQEAKTYAVKSGYIKYELSGNTTGTKELWWDDYGRKTCETEQSTTTTKMFGVKNTDKKHMTTVIVKDKFWVADYIDNKGSKGTVPMYKEGQELVADMSEKEQQEFADEVLAGMGGQKQGTESLNGYKCDIIKIMGVKSWVYKGLVLKTESKIMGIKTNEMFVDFKPNSKNSSSKFDPPKGVSYENLAKNEGMNSLMSAFGNLGQMEDEGYEDDSEEIVPVDYPFEKFKKVIKGTSLDGYRCLGTNSVDGMYAATFMKGLNSITIIAQSEKNIEEDKEYDSFKPFKHNGHTCRFGEIDKDDGTALIVEYPSYDMIVTIAAMPQKSKDEMLKIDDKFQF
jgi:hypothetical protein